MIGLLVVAGLYALLTILGLIPTFRRWRARRRAQQFVLSLFSEEK